MRLNHVVYVPHLRKAESRVMASLVPDLQLYASWDKPAEELPSKETSEASRMRSVSPWLVAETSRLRGGGGDGAGVLYVRILHRFGEGIRWR